MAREKLPGRVPVDPDIRIQPQRLSAPDIASILLRPALPIPLLVLCRSSSNQLPQSRPTPQHLRKPRILDLEPVIDTHGVPALRPPRRRGQREALEKRHVGLAEGRGEEVVDEADLVGDEGVEGEGGCGDEWAQGRPVRGFGFGGGFGG